VELALLTLLIVGGYLAACAFWPFVTCPRCDGGRKRSPSGKAWRNCPRCKGTGTRLRAGRVAWNAFRGHNR
jgi:DnaJ-class molecular chaperone